jgi:hypothetical protein
VRNKKAPNGRPFISIDGHRHPCLYRPSTIFQSNSGSNPTAQKAINKNRLPVYTPAHFWSLNIPGVWGQSPHQVARRRRPFVWPCNVATPPHDFPQSLPRSGRENFYNPRFMKHPPQAQGGPKAARTFTKETTPGAAVLARLSPLPPLRRPEGKGSGDSLAPKKQPCPRLLVGRRLSGAVARKKYRRRFTHETTPIGNPRQKQNTA